MTWASRRVTSPQILAQLRGNKSTLKTLLGRLVSRGAVRVEEINQRTYRYFAAIAEEKYVASYRAGFEAPSRAASGSTPR